MTKTLLKIAGYLAVGLGFIGAFVPMMPTTPFLLLAVYCFSKSSPNMKQWLLHNRTFGKYLSDYEAGNGIPTAVKITALITMWSSILFTVILLVDITWVRILLILISLAVSTHILNIKTLTENKENKPVRKTKILILSATSMEIEKFLLTAPSHISAETIGIGPYRSAYNTLKYIEQYNPEAVILAGIAGAYPSSNITVGDCFLVHAENSADMGAFMTDGFRSKFSERFVCPHITKEHDFVLVESNSISAAGAPFVNSTDAQIENMEGAAFFYVCRQYQMPFLELRAISNIVGEDFPKWDVELATTNLAHALNKLIDEIEA